MTRTSNGVDRPLIHHDGSGRERTAPDWETLSERLIREAQEDGRFDDLPGHGRPLVLVDDTYAGELALAHHLLRNAGAAPPWIEADKAVRIHLADIEALLERARHATGGSADRLARDLEGLADAHGEAVARLEHLAPTARQQRPRLDRDALRARLRAALSERPTS